MKDSILLFLKGIVIGCANVIPGVSGGTMAVVFGIYEELLGAISGFFKDWKKYIKFLLIVFAGIGTGILLLARFVEYGLAQWPEQTMFLFMGLVAGSLPSLWKETNKKGLKLWYLIPFLLGFVIMLILAFIPETGDKNHVLEFSFLTLLILLGSGFIGSVAMIIPGISGSFLLLLLGTYGTVIASITNFRILELFAVLIGVGSGILITSAGIKLLLEKFYGPTFSIIFGLVLGSLLPLWPGLSLGLGTLFSVLSFALGVTLAFISGRLSK